ncbi:MAG: hypothetical protein ACI3VE_00555 [Oscillospiraceae bacterium]
MPKYNKDAKVPLILSCYVCALGAFGAFFRWLQMQVARDAETGMMDPSILNILVPLTIICAAVLFYLRLKKLVDDGNVLPTEFYSALKGSSVLCLVISWVIGGITAIGGVVAMLNVALDAQRGLYTVIACLAILCGLSFPLICSAAHKRYSPGLTSLFMTLPVVMYCLWLIACYKANSNNPNLWVYAIEIIAVCCLIIAFYYTAGFPFGRARPRHAVYFCMMGAFLGIVTLADSRYMGLQLILLGSAGMLIMENWLIVQNIRNKEDAPEVSPSPAAEAVKAEEPAQDAAAPAPAETSDAPEPTIEAPAKKPKSGEDGSKLDSEVDEILREYKKP